jgi:hypothetical protein
LEEVAFVQVYEDYLLLYPAAQEGMSAVAIEAAIGKCMPICSERGLIQIILGEQPIFEVG